MNKLNQFLFPPVCVRYKICKNESLSFGLPKIVTCNAGAHSSRSFEFMHTHTHTNRAATTTTTIVTHSTDWTAMFKNFKVRRRFWSVVTNGVMVKKRLKWFFLWWYEFLVNDCSFFDHSFQRAVCVFCLLFISNTISKNLLYMVSGWRSHAVTTHTQHTHTLLY